MSSASNEDLGCWANVPLPYADQMKAAEAGDMKGLSYTTLGLVKLTQPDYFISYLEETGVVPKGYSKLDESQKEKLGWIIDEWLEEEVFESDMKDLDKAFLESQTSDTEEESEE